MRVPKRRNGFLAIVVLLIGLLLITRSTFVASASPVRQATLEPMDEGDAPDSSNHAGVGMTTYGGAVVAKFQIGRAHV